MVLQDTSKFNTQVIYKPIVSRLSVSQLSKKRDRERKRKSNPNRLESKSNSNLIQPISGLQMEGNRIVGVSSRLERNDVSIPLYNPAIHRAGDRVLIKPPHSKRLVETVIPELDAGGNPIPEY